MAATSGCLLEGSLPEAAGSPRLPLVRLAVAPPVAA